MIYWIIFGACIIALAILGFILEQKESKKQTTKLDELHDYFLGPKGKAFTRLEADDVFEYVTCASSYGKNVYSGKINLAYQDKLSPKDIANICDNYLYNFGWDVEVSNSGIFTCTIYTE